MRRIILGTIFFLSQAGAVRSEVFLGLGEAAAKKSGDLIDCAQNPADAGCDKKKGCNGDACNNCFGNGGESISGPAGPSGEDFDQAFRSLVVDPTDPDTVFVGTERNGILRTTDGGVTWKRLRYGLWHGDGSYSEVWDLAIHPSGASHGLFAAFTEGSLPISSPNATAGVYTSANSGNVWSRKNCGITSQKANSVLYDPNNPAVLILGVEGGFPSGSEFMGRYQDGGLYRSTDGGDNWNLLSLPGSYTTNAFWNLRARGVAPTSFYTFGFNFENTNENLGFLHSTDGGAHWSAFAPSLRALRIIAFDVSTDGQTIYAVERDAFLVNKSIDGGASWTTMGSNANGPIKVSPVNDDLVVFAGYSTLYRSTDGMQTSSPVADNGSTAFDDIEFAPSAPNTVYAIARGYNFYRSIDAGATWTLVKNLRSGVLNVQP